MFAGTNRNLKFIHGGLFGTADPATPREPSGEISSNTGEDTFIQQPQSGPGFLEGIDPMWIAVAAAALIGGLIIFSGKKGRR